MRREAVGQLLRYQCHIGHALTAEDMARGQIGIIENSLEEALRTLNENRALCEELAGRASSGTPEAERTWRRAAEQAQKRLEAVKEP